MAAMLSTLGPALLLAFLHQWASYLHPSKFIARKYWQAFADGISITYIFLQLLPEISHLASQQTLSDKQYTLQFSGPFASLSGWGEHYPFLPLLIGFTLFYGLEKWMQKASAQVSREEAQIHFWVHMLGLAIYKILLGYLLAQMNGWAAIVAFTLAMVMHFLVIDFHLVEMHRSAYQKIGRWILTVSFLIGWVISLFAVIASPVLAMLVSFVAGGAVLLIIQDEFSKEHESSFIAFLSAVVLYGALLLSF